jgi:hypothetical protein
MSEHQGEAMGTLGRFLRTNAIALLALVVATSGTAYASVLITRNNQVGPGVISGHHAPQGKHANIIKGSVGSKDLANHAVTFRKLGINSVHGGNVATNSLSLADLVGVDIAGTINLAAGAVAAHSCTSFATIATGAAVGQVPLLAFVGGTPAPAGLTFQLLKVTSPGHILMRVCNPTNTNSPAASGVGVRVVTFG